VVWVFGSTVYFNTLEVYGAAAINFPGSEARLNLMVSRTLRGAFVVFT
jgi:hypothetical protein